MNVFQWQNWPIWAKIEKMNVFQWQNVKKWTKNEKNSPPNGH